MDSSVTALILGLAGLFTTLTSAVLGFYFTAKARTASLRHHLYQEQVALTLKVLQALGRARLFALILSDKTSPHHTRAREDLARGTVALGRLSDSAAAILPTELYVEIRLVTSLFSDFSEAFDTDEDLSYFPAKLAGHMRKTALLARTYLGVDELSAESARLFTKKGQLKKLAAMSPDEILAIVKTPGA